MAADLGTRVWEEVYALIKTYYAPIADDKGKWQCRIPPCNSINVAMSYANDAVTAIVNASHYTPERAFCHVLADRNGVVGGIFACVWDENNAPDGGALLIEFLVSRPKANAASGLLQAATEWARGRGLRYLALNPADSCTLTEDRSRCGYCNKRQSLLTYYRDKHGFVPAPHRLPSFYELLGVPLHSEEDGSSFCITMVKGVDDNTSMGQDWERVPIDGRHSCESCSNKRKRRPDATDEEAPREKRARPWQPSKRMPAGGRRGWPGAAGAQE
jgi:hypothetical protein